MWKDRECGPYDVLRVFGLRLPTFKPVSSDDLILPDIDRARFGTHEPHLKPGESSMCVFALRSGCLSVYSYGQVRGQQRYTSDSNFQIRMWNTVTCESMDIHRILKYEEK